MTGKNQGGTAESFVPSKTDGFAFFVDIRAARKARRSLFDRENGG